MLNRLLLLFLLSHVSAKTAVADSSTYEPNVARGQELFKSHCFLCHGAQGKGDGRMAKLLQTKPANLTITQLANKKLAKVIREGGASAELSAQMPAWGDQFTAIDIQSLVLFINSLQLKQDKTHQNSHLLVRRRGLELATR